MTNIVSNLESKILTQLQGSRKRVQKLDFNNHIDYSGTKLRRSILETYKKLFVANSISESTSISDIITSTNIHYSDRMNGLFYADDYVKRSRRNDMWMTIQGLSNSHYWNVATHDSFFKIKDGVKPSDAIRSFFAGPTFPDCANVIQAAIYLSILNRVGDNKFNELFGNNITQLVITKYLYTEFSSESTNNPDNNPLFFLFDRIMDINYNDLQDGDILYIQGVEDYTNKHLSGFAPGWNLVCVRPNPTEEPTFIGFGPETFGTKSLTFNELRIKLIEFYNKEHSKETLEYMNKFYTKKPRTKEEHLSCSKITLAKMLKDDIKPLDSDIVGFKCSYCIRFSEDKFNKFLTQPNDGWHDKIITSSLKESFNLELSDNVSIHTNNTNRLSVENMTSCFENYQVTDSKSKELYDLSRNFAYQVIEDNSSPLGLVMSGNAGIGKTHLSVAILQFVHENSDKKILYIDQKYVTDYFQYNGTCIDIPKLLEGMDLIIYDDINSFYGSGANFLKLAIRYIFNNNKALVVSSNINLNIIYELLPCYIGYNNKIKNNFVVIQDIRIPSYRTPWIDINLLEYSNQEKLEVISKYTGTGASGIVIYSDKERLVDYDNIIDEYKKLVPNCNCRYILDPMRNETVFDLYVHNIDSYDTFIIKVDSNSEGEQLIKLVEKVHNQGSKIIVVSPSKENFIKYVEYTVNSFLEKELYQKRMDRLRIIFPHFF